MKEYRKRYWPLAAWAFVLCAGMGLAVWLAEALELGAQEMTALTMVMLLLSLLCLFALIDRGEYVYWINGGPDFEQAKAAPRAARREYARRHFNAMACGCAAGFGLLAAAYFLGWPEPVMVLLTVMCVIFAAIATIRIRWEDILKEEVRRENE